MSNKLLLIDFDHIFYVRSRYRRSLHFFISFLIAIAMIQTKLSIKICCHHGVAVEAGSWEEHWAGMATSLKPLDVCHTDTYTGVHQTLQHTLQCTQQWHSRGHCATDWEMATIGHPQELGMDMHCAQMCHQLYKSGHILLNYTNVH